VLPMQEVSRVNHEYSDAFEKWPLIPRLLKLFYQHWGL